MDQTEWTQTEWVIWALDCTNRKSIEFSNRYWLKENIMPLNIRVGIEKTMVDIFDVAELCKEPSTILIQDGTRIAKREFKPSHEAILLLKKEKEYRAFLYYPKE